VDLGVSAEVDNRAEVVVETLRALELLEQLNELDRAEEVRVLGGNLDDDGEVLANVALEHGAQRLERLVNGEAAKVVDEPVGVEEVGVDNDTLNVVNVLVVLESTLDEAGLLGEVGNTRTVVVREHLVAEDGVGDLRGVDEVHLEETSLERALLGLVVLEGVEEERRRLLDHVLSHEDVDNAVEVNKRTALVIDELSGELGTLVGVDAHKVLQQLGVVGGEANLLGVEDNLVKLAKLGKASNDLVGDVGAEVDRQGEVHVDGANHVSKLLAALELHRSAPPLIASPTLFSLSHFSRSCFLPCWITGRASSSDSYVLSSPFSRRIPKYWRMGERVPGTLGSFLKVSIVWGYGGCRGASWRRSWRPRRTGRPGGSAGTAQGSCCQHRGVQHG
jgi:hypothetical protein